MNLWARNEKMAPILITARLDGLPGALTGGRRQRITQRLYERPDLLQHLALLALVGVTATALLSRQAARSGGSLPWMPPTD